MKRNHQHFGVRPSIRSRLAGYTCLVLGMLWALSPILHQVFHAAEVGHQHPSGSVHRHSHGDDASHSHGPVGLDTFDTVRADHDRRSDRNRLGDESDSNDPPLRPTDERSEPIFLSLEIAGLDTIAMEDGLGEFSPALGIVCVDGETVYAAVLMGASGPRGPPV